MVRRQSTQHDLRCFCSTEPIIAKYGIDETGNLYIHVKGYKQKRVLAEVVITAPARVKIHCRICGRWHEIIMRMQTQQVRLKETRVPRFLAS